MSLDEHLGERWGVYASYGEEACARATHPDPERPGWSVLSFEGIEPDEYVVQDMFSDDEGPEHRFKTATQAERKASELNRLDVQGPLDPEFAERRKRLKRFAPRFGGYMHDGPQEARWPVRPEKYLIDGFDDGWHGEEWQELADTEDAVKETLESDVGHEVSRVIDLDTGKEVSFERTVSVSVEMSDG